MRHFWFLVFDLQAMRQARAALRQGPVRLFADTVSAEVASLLAREPLPASALQVMPVNIAVEDEQGRNIHARADELVSIIIARASRRDGYGWLPAAQRPWGAEWLRIEATFLYERTKQLADFLAFVERAYLTQTLEPPDELIVDFGRHLGADAVAEIAEPIKLHLPFPVVLRGHAPSALVAAAYALVRTAAWLIVAPLRRLQRGRPEIRIDARGEGIVLVQYERASWERMPLGHAQDWHEHSGLPPGRVVFYFNRDDSPLNDAARCELARRGFGWVDYRTPALHARHRTAGLLCVLAQLLRVFPAPWDGPGLRRWAMVARLLPVIAWHREFLHANKALAVYQHLEFLPGQVALNLACRQEGVTFVWSFWSVLFFFEYMRYAFADLLLTWGSLDRGFANAAGFDYRYALETGVLGYDGAEPDDAQRAAELRARLFAKPHFVVTLFDSSYDQGSIHHSAERCALFYKIALAQIRDNPDWGCLIKSKGDSYDRLPQQPGLQDVVAGLEAAGRCLRLPSAMKPTLAALAGDAVACFSINSAGFQAAVGTKRPVLHFDPNHLTMHPIAVAGGEGKVIFRDAESFAAALGALASGDRRFGDLSPWARLIDPFCDGLGRKRSGEAIRDYVAARDRGLTRDAALREAAMAHAVRYGKDLATTRLAEHDGEADRLWREVKRRHYPERPADFPLTAATLATEALPHGKGHTA